jgi:ADP-heptose:LPS heptosyltransferase
MRESIYRTALAPLVRGLVDEIHDGVQLGASWSEFLRACPLAGRYFDIIIDTQTVIRSSLLLRRIPHRVFISAAAGFWLSDLRPARRDYRRLTVQERALELIRLASGHAPDPGRVLPLPAEYRAAAAQLLPSGPTYIGIAPGAGARRKCWPLDRYLEFARAQIAAGRRAVFFLGPEERDWIAPIRTALREALFPEQDNSARYPRGPLLAIALAERLQIAVSNDSGTGHILATAGIPLVLLFGPSNPGKFFVPRADRILVQAADYGGRDMTRIPVSAVLAAAETLLRRAAPGQA